MNHLIFKGVHQKTYSTIQYNNTVTNNIHTGSQLPPHPHIIPPGPQYPHKVHSVVPAIAIMSTLISVLVVIAILCNDINSITHHYYTVHSTAKALIYSYMARIVKTTATTIRYNIRTTLQAVT